jgi:small neutral amino acid transporter SnatA (MarC family)
MTKEQVGGLVFLAAGIYGLIHATQLPLGRWNEPGPGVFPLALSILLCATGLGWTLQRRSKREIEKRFNWQEFLEKLATPLKIGALTLAYILVLDRVGYFPTSLLYVFVLFWWVSRYKLWIAAGMAVLVGVGSWLFFERLLAVQLPKGFFSL